MSSRRWFFAILAVLSLTAQNAAPSVFKVQDRYTKLEQYINMRDGVKLFTSIKVNFYAGYFGLFVLFQQQD